MAMLMVDLYRHRRTDARDPREAWLSACLAEVLTEDPELRTALLTHLRLRTEREVSVDHQRRYGDVGESQVADVVLESDDLEVIVECKDRDRPNLVQMNGYAAKRPRAVTVLVAGSTAIERYATGPDWEHHQRVPWEWFYALAAPNTGNLLWDWLRRAFREALAWAGYAAVDVTCAEARSFLTHWRRTEQRWREVQLAVLSLLPARSQVSDDWWQSDGLSAWWETQRIPTHSGLPVRGLGFELHPTRRNGVDWTLLLRRSSSSPSLAKLRELGFEKEENSDWWYTPLQHSSGGANWNDELRQVVQHGRRALTSLELPAGRGRLPKPGHRRVSDLFDADADSIQERIWAAARSLRERLARQARGRAGSHYVTISHDHQDTGWFWVQTGHPGRLSLRLGWGPPPTENLRRFPIVRDWFTGLERAERGPVTLRQVQEARSASFDVQLTEVPLQEAVEHLVRIGARIVEDRRTELFRG